MKTVPREYEKPLEDGDYCAIQSSLWIRVGNVAIHILGSENGVGITACQDGDENDTTLSSMFVSYPEQ